jgi:hypothetical protein
MEEVDSVRYQSEFFIKFHEKLLEYLQEFDIIYKESKNNFGGESYTYSVRRSAKKVRIDAGIDANANENRIQKKTISYISIVGQKSGEYGRCVVFIWSNKKNTQSIDLSLGSHSFDNNLKKYVEENDEKSFSLLKEFVQKCKELSIGVS